MQETVKKVLNGDFNRKKALLFLITALLTVIVWNLPIDSFGIEGLTNRAAARHRHLRHGCDALAHRGHTGMGYQRSDHLRAAVLRQRLRL